MPVTKYSTTCAPPLEGTAPINRDTITETADDPNQKLPDEGNDDVGGSEEERSNRDDSEGAVSDVDE